MRKLISILLLSGTVACMVACDLGGGDADYQNGLDAYRRGDYETALHKWQPLAEQGNIEAQLHLGQMYRKGEGIPQNYKIAAKWYKLAAEQGNSVAQLNFGVMHYSGHGMRPNYIHAYMWGSLSASKGNEKAGKFKYFIAQNMTPEDIATAQNLARKCIDKNYKGC